MFKSYLVVNKKQETLRLAFFLLFVKSTTTVLFCCNHRSDAGTGGTGRPLAPQYLGDQLTLFLPGRADYPHLLQLAPPIFFTFPHHCIYVRDFHKRHRRRGPREGSKIGQHLQCDRCKKSTNIKKGFVRKSEKTCPRLLWMSSNMNKKKFSQIIFVYISN